ncbi:MAG: SDR family NAD(P)-dependent oxidoreductase, partial [Alphaproteobacteria bacterium]|nr:SDR family NAD(P)-dependent oxidoreductase [Alphaproteobacteria bacterium]
NHKDLNTIIFNAGIYIPDNYESFSFKNAKQSFDINVLSVYFAIEVLRKNIQLDHNHTLAIVSSVAGYRGLPKSILYGPTKAALINLCESLKVDLPKEVNIKLINPGFVETPATSINNFKMPFLITAEKAATIIFTRIYKKGFEISFPFPFNFMMKFGSILPYKVYFKITEYISRNEQKN